MRVKVRVKGSPYKAVSEGSIGEVIGRKFLSTAHEILKVRFTGGVVWSFHPDELEVLDNEEVR